MRLAQRKRHRRFALALPLVVVACMAAACGSGGPAGGGDGSSGGPINELVVAAASDLRPVFDELARGHEADTGTRVTLVYGSSGLLARQAIEGAPFDVFASADTARAEAVASALPGDRSPPVPFATGRLVLVGAGPDASLADLVSPAFGLIAIANPEHAPYGRAAEEALRAAGVWEALTDRLVLADNVAAATQLVVGGDVDAGVVARSLVEPGDPAGLVMISETAHAPIRQSLVVLVPDTAATRARRAAAEAFVARVLSLEGRALLEARGFALPPAPDAGSPKVGGG
jgi:molybdate transport system substrate-binding protein